LSPRPSRFERVRRRLEAVSLGPRWQRYGFEFLLFGIKQAWASLFGGAMLTLVLVTHLFYPADAALARYDFQVLGAVAIQAGMLLFRLESWEEAQVIAAFHVAGTVMEMFKVQAGSWLYPEPSLLRIGDVPLFSGFMYAAVGSYIARVSRIFHLRYDQFAPPWTARLLGAFIYLNFFAHHWLPDIRVGLFVATIALFWRTWVRFTVYREERSMPLLVGWALVALFIWFAENIGTYSNAWLYPQQRAGWSMVSPAKYGSWYLLMILSWVLVGTVQRDPIPRGKRVRNCASGGR